MPFPRSNRHVSLTVKTGLHAGAMVQLGADTTIGQAAGNGMRLLDDGIAAQHARLTLHRKGITVIPLMGGVSVDGVTQAAAAEQLHQLAPGRSIEMAFGPVVATLARPRKAGPRAVHLFALVLVCLLILVPVPWQGATQSAASALRPVQVQGVARGAEQDAETATLHQISQAATARFASMKLNRTMQISVAGTGTRALSTTISGVVEPAMLADFEGFLAWYDAQPDWPALLNQTRRQSPADQPLPAIAAVLLQPKPGVIISNGRRIGVGEALPGGWTLTSVDAGAVVLTREGQAHAITLATTGTPPTP